MKWNLEDTQEQIDDFIKGLKKIKKSSIIVRGSAYHVSK